MIRQLAWMSTLLWLAACATASAQSYPTRPIRLILPTAPGSSPDVLARPIAQRLGEALGQTVVVENVPGAAGAIAVERAMKAPPDGHTLLYGFNSLVTMNPALYRKLPYDVERDMAPVGMVMAGSYVWAANNDLAANSIPELIALAKARPRQISYVSIGPGTAAHLGVELLAAQAGVEFLHVPSKSALLSEVIGGQVQMKIDPTSVIIPQVRAGKLKALAVTGPKRLPQLPDVPAVAESVPGYELLGWHAVWAPAGTAREIIARLNAELAAAVRAPESVARLAAVAFEPAVSTPDELAAQIRREAAVWARLIKARNITLD
ncbi:MAG: tripartite tricarboxylate transporter substrate binding protein [Burkholderiales bacterium]|nr:tripartite tricarboxylate transporter substrate binding protein [Burkholderiales bacterium]